MRGDALPRLAAVTHNYHDGIKGAQATAAAICLARTGSDKTEIKRFVEKRFGYDFSTFLDATHGLYPRSPLRGPQL